MVELLVHVCDGITGARVDTVPASAFSYSRLLSARGDGSAAIPLDGSFGKAALKALLEPWRYTLVHERDGLVKYNGYITGRPYTRGSSSVGVALGDVWALLGRRLAVDRTTAPAEKWSETVTGNRATHAARGLVWMRDTYTGTPDASFPMTIPGVAGGTSVTRTYFGYHLPTGVEFLSTLMDEGLDIYFKPEWSTPGIAGWYAHRGDQWSSGLTHEFSVTADKSEVTGFSEQVDAARVTNNSIRVGEGSEVDMLTRSMLDPSSVLPLLERVSMSKTVSDPAQLTALASQDLVTFGSPTVQWDFKVTAGTPIDVGDSVRLHFDGDPWIDDGFYSRRVVKVSGDLSDQITVSVQSTGGA